MAQCLRVLAILLEVWSSNPSNHMTDGSQPSLMGSNPSFWHAGVRIDIKLIYANRSLKNVLT